MSKPLGRDSLTPDDLANQVARHISQTPAPSSSTWLRDSLLIGRLISGVVVAGIVAVLVGGTYFGVSWLVGRAPAAAVEVLSLAGPTSPSDPETRDATHTSGLSSVMQVPTTQIPTLVLGSSMSPFTPSLPPVSSGNTAPSEGIPGMPPPLPAVPSTVPTLPGSTTPTTSAPPASTTTGAGHGTTTTTTVVTTTSEPETTTTVVEATTTTCRGNSGSGSGGGPCGP